MIAGRAAVFGGTLERGPTQPFTMTAPPWACKLKVRNFVASLTVLMRIENILWDSSGYRPPLTRLYTRIYSGPSESFSGGSAVACLGSSPRVATLCSAVATVFSAAASVRI